jgi:hypothetical protein
VVTRSEELLVKVRAHLGASVAYSADLRACLLEAGFERTEAEAGVENPAGSAADPPLLPFVLQNQLREQVFRQTVLEQGWATEAELDQLTVEAGALAERKDLFGFVVFVQALGWVAS